ncbi:MAG: hypothetical protein GX575_24650 [Candidatus Anammoximicrobium sp.]|nr:hypothetical protein [Candidatus Anammoximicrobium sp.]
MNVLTRPGDGSGGKWRAWCFALCGCLTVAGLTATAAASPPAASKPLAGAMLRDSLDNELLRGLDLPARPNAAPPAADRPADRPAQAASELDPQRLETLAEGEDIGLESADPLDAIGRRMRLAEALLSRQITSPKTQRVQQLVIEDLNRLIEQLQKQCSNAAAKSKSAPQPRAKPGSKSRAGSGENTGANQPAAESTERTGSQAADREELARLQQMLNQIWGHLPPKLRDQMQSSAIEEFLPKYEKLIEAYYTRLVEEGKK